MHPYLKPVRRTENRNIHNSIRLILSFLSSLLLAFLDSWILQQPRSVQFSIPTYCCQQEGSKCNSSNSQSTLPFKLCSSLSSPRLFLHKDQYPSALHAVASTGAPALLLPLTTDSPHRLIFNHLNQYVTLP